MSKKESPEAMRADDKPECFVIMPISESEIYVKGHFKHVYDDILCPACDRASFKAIRADQVKESNLIHLDILQKLLDAPMALCDLSTRNPNVLFELALRQAFDKPVILVQEIGTAAVFDISPLRYTEYRKERTYHEVLEDQASIATAIKDTYEAHKEGKGVNSIVRLLALSKPATLPNINASDASADIQQLILGELGQLRDEIRNSRKEAAATRRVVRERHSPDLSSLVSMLEHVEFMIASASNPAEVESARDLLRDCKMHFVAVRTQDLSATDRIVVSDIEIRLFVLDENLKKAFEKIVQKKQK